MSHLLISLDPHLRQLRDEGFELEIRSNHLLIHSMPYVNAKGEVIENGVLVMPLAGESSTIPASHVAHFIGGHPCAINGTEIVQIKNPSGRQTLAENLIVDHCFSAKPRDGAFANFHEKVVLYDAIISGPAEVLKPGVSARTFRPIASDEGDAVFQYMDTASSRAGILVPTQRFHKLTIAIVGLGGTGAYVLDQVAKTPVAQIDLFDGDTALQHNAFRYPGAMSLEELKAAPSKVAYLRGVYSRMHRGIVEHAQMITADNVAQLLAFDYVFLCVDKGSVRRLVVDAIRGSKTTLIDVGMGVHLDEETQKVWGVCRVSTLTSAQHAHAEQTIPMVDAEDHGIYKHNIQIADLNSLNAALAVLRWKKLCGFYSDTQGEHQTAFTTNTNVITNSEMA